MKKTVVLIGPPNAGKTTFFNKLTGSHSKTVNYPGSTVDISIGHLKENPEIVIVDTPGLYSFKANSEDEEITLNSLMNLKHIVPEANFYPDLVISVVDVCQLSRHLLLTRQLIEKGYPVLVMLTMYDCAKKDGFILDLDALSKALDSPVYMADKFEANPVFKQEILKYCKNDYSPKQCLSLSTQHLYADNERIVSEVLAKQSGFLQKFDLDKLFLHPIWGGLLFFVIMGLLFYSIFFLAAPFMDAIDSFFGFFNSVLLSRLPDTWFRAFLTDGLVAGVASVLVFVPQIALLFFGIGILESTGYLARGAVIADKPLSFLGLNGRCFVPLLSGFACAIPALMATRNIQQTKIKRLCCFLIPLMQCSARLPVYGLLLALLFGDHFFKASLAMIAIYIGSLVIAFFVAVLLKKGLGLDDDSRFTIELPKWKIPNLSLISLQALSKTRSFIGGAGPIILLVSFVFWLLSAYPSEQNSYAMMIGQVIEPVFIPMGLDWRVGVALILSFVAREVFVSALVILFAAGADSGSISTTLSMATFQGSEQLIFTTPTIIGLIVFFMIALQCGATFAMARTEMKSTRLALIQLVVYIGSAYLLAVGIVQFSRLF